ncbi:MAG: hypothetical protein JO253_08000 [Alphaproteobacteria bacterium]|nr:hypothetical protein [Alphaproteobacteria bacterium]
MITIHHVMLIVLAASAAAILYSLWRAHVSAQIQFNALDLLMENGRVSRIAVAFMLVLLVSTWVIINLTVRDKITEGYYLAYMGAWVTPLVTKVVFNKNEPPAPPEPKP